jgi:hypothetical protein
MIKGLSIPGRVMCEERHESCRSDSCKELMYGPDATGEGLKVRAGMRYPDVSKNVETGSEVLSMEMIEIQDGDYCIYVLIAFIEGAHLGGAVRTSGLCEDRDTW